jgi:hypothetical protein
MKEFKLDNEPKITSGFNATDGYFENFENAVMTKLTEKETTVIDLFTRRKWVVAIAAIFVIALSIPIVNQISTSTTKIDAVQLENYLAEQSSLAEDDIVELLDHDKIQQIKLELNVDSYELEETLLNSTNLEDYIIN